MPKQRILETDQGIQGEFNVQVYDQMQRRLWDKGWIEMKDIIKSASLQDWHWNQVQVLAIWDSNG